MSMDLSGSIDLLKLHNSGMATIRGVRCLVVPIEDNVLYITKDDTTGRAKACYLGLVIRERKEVDQWGKTHYCKQQLSKEFREGGNPEIIEQKKKHISEISSLWCLMTIQIKQARYRLPLCQILTFKKMICRSDDLRPV